MSLDSAVVLVLFPVHRGELPGWIVSSSCFSWRWSSSCLVALTCTVLVSSKEVFLSALLLAHIIMLLNGVSALARV